MRYEVAHLANEDLREIYRWGIEQFGDNVADRYYDGLLETFDLLARNPRAGRVLNARFRLHAHRAHHILYEVLAGDRVVIARVLNGRQDLGSHL